MDGRRRKTVHADAAAGGTSEGRQPLVDVHGVHVRDAHVAIVRRPHIRAIGHANRAYEVFRRYSPWIFTKSSSRYQVSPWRPRRRRNRLA